MMREMATFSEGQGFRRQRFNRVAIVSSRGRGRVIARLNYLIWKPLAAKSTAVFYFSDFEMYMYKSMILYTKNNGILLYFEKSFI